jgi:hypothetical protein
MGLFLLIVGLMLVLVASLNVGSPINLTSEKPITGKDGTADFSVDDGTSQRHYKCILDMFRLREVIEMTVADTFCSEGSASQDAGRSQLQFEIAGLLMKDGPLAQPLIPAPQNAAIIATFSTGCFVSMSSSNFTESALDRVVNQNGRMGARGLSKGIYTVTWDIA